MSFLPLELERHIFETCARSQPICIPKLMLVAWRVKEWVEPLMYGTITLNGYESFVDYPTFASDSLSLAMESKPASFFQFSVRNLLLELGTQIDYKLLLSMCTGLQNLWILAEMEELIPTLTSLSLKRLHADVSLLLSSLSPTHPFFSGLTHLELLGPADPPSPENMDFLSNLSLIPQLSHLAFNDADFIPICPQLLQSCKSLAVLILVEGDHQYRADVDAAILDADLAQDTRFVAMQCLWYVWDWQTGPHTGVDYWTRAENFVAKRHRGEIDVLGFRIENDTTEVV
ncbi:hypothetical protein C8R43DRAFT_1004624 [Mycena crocata]|nr:hypothetical protein C8R43DRAFT_1004624 [Mycena crocata]